MKKELYPFQVKGAEFHSSRLGSGNADQMGLGKTPQAIETINRTRPDNVLVICPATIKLYWQREMETWLTHPITPGIVNGDDWVDESATIINYDILDRHISSIHKKRWDMVIVDEAHYIKNFEALRTAAVLGIPSQRRLWLTGTPILNRPIELLPLLYYIGAVDERKFWQYQARFCNAQLKKHNRTDSHWDVKGHSNLEELADNFAPFIIRRTKKEVLPELPEKTRQVVEIGSGPANGAFTSWIRRLNKIEQEATTLEEYSRALRRFGVELSLEFGDYSTARRECGLAQLPEAISYLKDTIEDSGKVVCFAHHKDYISGLRKAFAKNSVCVIGGMDVYAKQAAVDRFQSDDAITLFIGNTQAAGIGVDGLQNVCNRVVFAELDWTPGLMEQAEDRTHRFGQRRPVLITHLVENGTLDVVMALNFIAKQRVIDKVMK